MAPVATFAGSLAPKKKSELQDIASALKISDQGTKDEIQNRIKKHLDVNPDLEEDTRFAGLFGRKRRGSVQPQPSARPEKPRSSTRHAPFDPIREITPQADQPDVSTALKKPPLSPDSGSADSTPTASPKKSPLASPVSVQKPLSGVGHPLEPEGQSSPAKPPPSPAKVMLDAIQAKPAEILSAIQTKPAEIMEAIPRPTEIKAAVQRFQPQEYIPNGTEYLDATRAFLSNSQNIWTITALFELLYILNAVIPWRYIEVPLSPTVDTSTDAPRALSLPYAPLATFQTSAFWAVLLHWAVPTLIAPALVGHLISFSGSSPSPSNPASVTTVESASIAGRPSHNEAPPATPFDPLTAAIIRLAASLAYPYASPSSAEHIYGLDVLGYNTRVFNASLGLAFAFAEAVQGAPKTFAKRVVEELKQRDSQQGLVGTPERLALGEAVSSEVD